jgi:hypothetical protein
MSRSPFRGWGKALLLSLVLVAIPFAAGAKEESKIKIRLVDLIDAETGNGRGHAATRADVMTHMQGSRTILKLRARGLEAETEYVLLCKDAEDSVDFAELARFTSASNGTAKLSEDLSRNGDVSAPVDPRGKFLVIAEGVDESTEILGGWLYGEPQDDGPMTKIKEVTELAADEGASPSGSVAARYDMRPNGRGKLAISMRGVPVDDYEILVNGVLVATLTPNPAGNAKADFRTRPRRGKGSGKVKPHNKKQLLDFDPRRKEILVQLTDETAMFTGPMIAQIEGLNFCSSTSTDSPLLGDMGSGVASVEVQENCETAFDVEIVDVAAGSYDLYVSDMVVATFEAADDGFGTITGSVRFDPTPDVGEGELLLDFPVDSGSLVDVFDVFDAGADSTVDLPVLSGELL